jgi:hypothetical protein
LIRCAIVEGQNREPFTTRGNHLVSTELDPGTLI